MYHLSVVFPCYNPPQLWQQHIIENIHTFLQSHPDCTTELVIVNDGSPKSYEQNAKEMAQELNIPVLYHGLTLNRGKGNALRTGVALATGQYIIMTDIDFPYTPESFHAIYAALKEGADVAAGMRNESYTDNIPKFRAILSRLSRWLFVKVFSLRVSDTQAGLKGINQKAKPVFLSTTIDRYLFDLEFLCYASARRDFVIAKVPIVLREGITVSSMRLSILLSELNNLFLLLFKIYIRRIVKGNAS